MSLCEAEGGLKFENVFSFGDDGTREEVADGMVGDTEFPLHTCNDRG